MFVLEGFKGAQPKLRNLTADMPEGSFCRPDLSYDGKKVLFAYCKSYPQVPDLKDKASKSNVPEDAFYHVFEINLDGTGRRQLTHGRYDDFDARYLPSGEIVFLSTRKGQFLQSTAQNTAATAKADLPDSYVRCGGDNYRPVPVFTLHVMDGQGGSLRPISAFENFEWTPAVANDGQILYTRWDYIDRFNGHFFSLWSAHPDGTNPQLVYGNYTMRPQVVAEARPIPRSQNLVFTAAAHHSITGGSLVLFDRSRGTVKALRVIGVPPKVQPHMNNPSIGVSREDPGKFLLATAPVEEDGSAHFRVPSGMSVFFQAVDGEGLAIQTMRSLTYVWPKQTLSCIGCHESREAAPPMPGRPAIATARAPSKLAPGPSGSWPLRFDKLVQPVLDKNCVSCHRPDSPDEKGCRLDLTAAKAYESLLEFGGKDLRQLAFEKDRSVVGECCARKSKLLALLKGEKGHAGVCLDAESLGRLVIWMDLYAQRLGHFSDQQEKQLADLRRDLAPMLAE